MAALITFDDDENNNIREFREDEAALHMCATATSPHGGEKHTHTHTCEFIRLFYYTSTIKQSNEIIIMCVRFPGGGGGFGGSDVIFF